MYGDITMEELMKRAQQKSENLDNELDKMIESDPQLKHIHNNDIDLDDLDDEKKNASDVELDALEDSLDEGDNKNKKAVKTEKSETALKQKEKDIPKTNKKLDLFPVLLEKGFHNQSKMKSMGVINREKEIMEEAVKLKTENNSDDVQFFKDKIFTLDLEANKIQNLVANGVMSLDQYKTIIKSQLSFEVSVLKFLTEKFMQNEKNKKEVSQEAFDYTIERVKERMKILEEEINQEIPQEEEEEENNNDAETNENKEDEKTNEDPGTKEKDNDKNDKSEESIKKEEPKPEIKVDEKMLNLVKSRLYEYKNVYHYCIENNLSLRAEEANKKASQLYKELKRVQNGEEVSEFELPISVTPDFVYGYNSEERQRKYYDLIKEISNKKNQIQSKLNELIDKFKEFPEKQREKHMASIKKVLSEKKGQVDLYSRLVKKLLEDQKNLWIPCPLGTTTEETEKVEVINEDISPTQIEIYFGKNTYNKDYYLYTDFQVSEKSHFKDYVYIEKPDFYNKKLNYHVEKNEMKHIHKKTIEVKVYKSRFLIGSKLKGSFSIKLSELKSKCTMEKSIPMTILSKRFEPTYDVVVRIREPTTDKQYKDIVKPVFNITKTYKPYDKNKDYTGNIEHRIIDKDISELKPVEKVSSNQVKNTKSPITNDVKKESVDNKAEEKKTNNINNGVNEEKIKASDLNQIDIEDPDNIEALASLMVLEMRSKEIEEEIKKIDGRPPMNLRQKKMKMAVKLKLLKEGIQNGELGLEDYVKMVEIQYQRDVKLAKYFQQNNEDIKYNIVDKRLAVLKKELYEGLKMIKK